MDYLDWILSYPYGFIYSFWTYQVYIKVPTRYFTDTAGNIFTA